jgi:hypothetical protein
VFGSSEKVERESHSTMVCGIILVDSEEKALTSHAYSFLEFQRRRTYVLWLSIFWTVISSRVLFGQRTSVAEEREEEERRRFMRRSSPPFFIFKEVLVCLGAQGEDEP